MDSSPAGGEAKTSSRCVFPAPGSAANGEGAGSTGGAAGGGGSGGFSSDARSKTGSGSDAAAAGPIRLRRLRPSASPSGVACGAGASGVAGKAESPSSSAVSISESSAKDGASQSASKAGRKSSGSSYSRRLEPVRALEIGLQLEGRGSRGLLRRCVQGGSVGRSRQSRKPFQQRVIEIGIVHEGARVPSLARFAGWRGGRMVGHLPGTCTFEATRLLQVGLRRDGGCGGLSGGNRDDGVGKPCRQAQVQSRNR